MGPCRARRARSADRLVATALRVCSAIHLKSTSARAAFTTKKNRCSPRRNTVRSSIMPPVGVHIGEYRPCPTVNRLASFGIKRCTDSSAPGPVISISPMWETSKSPAAVRTLRCSSTMPVYWTGISQPPNSIMRAPAARCRANRLVCFGCVVTIVMRKPHYQLCHADRMPSPVWSGARLLASGSTVLLATAQERNDLVVGGLREVVVELSDRVEHHRSVEAEDVIRLTAEPLGPVRWGDGDGRDDPLWTHGPHRPQGRDHSCPGGNPVVDHDRGPRRPIRKRAIAAVQTHAPTDLLRLLRGLLPQISLIHSQGIHQGLIKVEGAVVGDGPDRQLRVSRRTELARDDDIQRGP